MEKKRPIHILLISQIIVGTLAKTDRITFNIISLLWEMFDVTAKVLA